MESQNYKYDVAFSFLQEDEQLAITLSDLLQGRFNTFIYSEKQAELVGKDGERTFNQVFGEQARIVVVLYRNGWGETKWTRIEMTAIKNRAFDSGYDFTLFILLDRRSQLPPWIPKTQIWFNYDRWGLEGATSIIEYKTQQVGVIEKKETVEERAARIGREIEAKRKREKFLNSEEGVGKANNEIPLLFSEIEKITKNIEEKNTHIRIELDKQQGGHALTLSSHGYGLRIRWVNRSSNTLRDSYLYIALRKRASAFDVERENKALLENKFTFDVSRSEEFGWSKLPEKKFYSSAQLGEFCVDIILNRIKDLESE